MLSLKHTLIMTITQHEELSESTASIQLGTIYLLMSRESNNKTKSLFGPNHTALMPGCCEHKKVAPFGDLLIETPAEQPKSIGKIIYFTVLCVLQKLSREPSP